MRTFLLRLPLFRAAGVALCLVSLGASSAAQSGGPLPAANIFTCVDARGNRITSDRPIMDCIGREQRQLNSDGSLRRVIPPALTPAERDARDAREREAAAERQRARDAAQRDQALVMRYPDRAAHDAGLKDALAQTQAVLDAASQHIADLTVERKVLNEQMEFYAKDPSKAPLKLRRSIEDNKQAMQEQQRAIAAQQDERDRIQARFDDETKRLEPLWAAAKAATGASTAANANPPARPGP